MASRTKTKTLLDSIGDMVSPKSLLRKSRSIGDMVSPTTLLRKRRGEQKASGLVEQKNLSYSSEESSSVASQSPTNQNLVLRWFIWISFSIFWSGYFTNWWSSISDHNFGPGFGVYDPENRAHWRYTADTRFDNTIWTWGTDYLLTIATWTCAWRVFSAWRAPPTSTSEKMFVADTAIPLCWMLIFNGLATLFGAIAHQTYTPADLVAGPPVAFRILWTACGASAAAAGPAMGLIADAVREGLVAAAPSGRLEAMPQIGSQMWLAYGAITTLCIIRGDYSCLRPAADIFIAGITVAPATFYLLAILAIHKADTWGTNLTKTDFSCTGQQIDLSRTDDAQTQSSHKQAPRDISFVGFALVVLFYIAPAPSLTAYPVLLSFGLPLSTINFILHLMLGFAWIGQWWITERIFL